MAYLWPRTLRRPERPPKLVYLDLKDWIALSKAHAGHVGGNAHRELLTECVRLREAGAAVFPLSDSTYMEISQITRHRQRRALREVIEVVSQLQVITARSVIATHEVEAVLNEFIGPSSRPINTMDYLDRGFARAFGMAGGFTVRDAAGVDVTEATRAAHAGGPQAFDAVFSKATKDLDRQVIDGPAPHEESNMRDSGWDPRAAMQIAQNRAQQERDQVATLATDPRWRRGRLRDVIAAREVLIELDRVLGEGLQDRTAGLDDVLGPPERTRTRLDAMPSFDVAVTIKTAYHRDPNHRWTINDIHDIDAMGSALPYCDVVVTDKAVADQVERTGLADRLGTTVLRHLADLPGRF